MRRRSFVAVMIVATLSIAATAVGAGVATATPRLRVSCFAAGGATCTYVRSTGIATINSTPDGSYAGLNVTRKGIAGTLLSRVTFSFNYLCADNTTRTCSEGGSPEWGFPIDTNGDGLTDGYAYIDAPNCGYTGTVNNNCIVYFNNVGYATWALFAATNSTYTLSNETPFILTEGDAVVGTPGLFNGQISNVVLFRS